MNTYDELKMLYGAYFGVNEMDEYKTKEFVLEKINKEIDKFIERNRIFKDDIAVIKEKANKQDLIVKLQDSLYVLKGLDVPFELMLLIKSKVAELKVKK